MTSELVGIDIVGPDGSGRERFDGHALPVVLGDDPGTNVRLKGAEGEFQVGYLDGRYFLQRGRNGEGLRLNGALVAGSTWLSAGDEIATGSARLFVEAVSPRLLLRSEARLAAGDTAPPELGNFAALSERSDSVEIQPVRFRIDPPPPRERAAKPQAATVITVALVAVLAILGWFAFTAKSVAIVVEPDPDEVSLPGTLFKFALGERVLLRRGTHRLMASKEGYVPLAAEFEVGSDSAQQVSYELEKLPGRVSIQTDPPSSAQVAIDGEPVGELPLGELSLAAGRHVLSLTAPRFVSVETEIEVVGLDTEQTVTVPLVPNWVPVRFESNPAGAEIFVDGEPVAVTPAVVEVDAGERLLEVRMRGFNAWRNETTVVPGQPTELEEIVLQEADGRVQLVSSPAAATVAVDGRVRGQTPVTVTLPPGKDHEIRLSKPGYRPVTRRLSVAADSGRRLVVEMQPEIGEVAIVTQPPGATLTVDGEPIGTAPRSVELPARAHRVVATLEGYSRAARTVTPRPGFPQELEIALEPLAQTGVGLLARRIVTPTGSDLLLVEPGQFTMGSSRREQGRRSNEILRRVELTRPYYLGANEVTNAEFRRFQADHSSGAIDGNSLDADEQPVVNVTYEQAVRYCNWLSLEEGLSPVYEESNAGWVAARPLRNGYRLPTEAEWAYAARYAGRSESGGVRFSWGDELPPPDRSGNLADVGARGVFAPTLVTYSDGFIVSAPAGSFPANPAGFRDLGGNVSEWIQDFYNVNPPAAGEVLKDPLGPETGRFHIVRGPSFRSASLADLRLAQRSYSAGARDDLGFRVARNAEPDSVSNTARAEP